jgi:DNA modification methylase
MKMTKSSLGAITIFTGDARDLPFPNNSIDLIVAHPPQFGLESDRYGGDVSKQINFDQSEKKMLKGLEQITEEAYRLLKNNGSFFVASGSYLNMDIKYLLQTIDNSDFSYFGKILQNGFIPDNPEDFTFERIKSESVISWYHFVKGDQPFVNPFKVKKYNNPVWNLSLANLDDEVDSWLVETYPYTSDAINKEVPKRIIEMFSKKGHLVLDMFGGTGVVSTTAASLGRNAIVADISEDTASAAKLRIMLTFGEKYLNENVKVVKDERLNNKKPRVKK